MRSLGRHRKRQILGAARVEPVAVVSRQSAAEGGDHAHRLAQVVRSGVDEMGLLGVALRELLDQTLALFVRAHALGDVAQNADIDRPRRP